MNQHLPIIVSLTSTQSKLERASDTIMSLLTQSLKADQIILWLSKDSNALDEGVKTLPDSIKSLEKKGLIIKWTKNIGPYKKLIPTVKMMNRENFLIVTAADDIVYPQDWLKGLVNAYQKNEGCVICYHGKVMDKASPVRKWLKGKKLKSFSKWIKTSEVSNLATLGNEKEIFPDGTGGVLYPSERLHEEIFNKSVYLRMAPKHEDVWFKAMTLLTDTKVHCVDSETGLPLIKSQQLSGISNYFQRRKEDRLVQEVLERYSLI